MKPSYLLLLLITVVSGAAPPSAPFYIQSKANGLFVVIDASSKILSAISSSSNYAGVFNYVPSSYLTDHKTGLFVSAESDGASALVANRQSNGIWETFTFAQSGTFIYSFIYFLSVLFFFFFFRKRFRSGGYFFLFCLRN